LAPFFFFGAGPPLFEIPGSATGMHTVRI
jgi:hypothetical protein